MIEETDPGIDVCLTGTVQIDGDDNVGLVCLAAQRGNACHNAALHQRLAAQKTESADIRSGNAPMLLSGYHAPGGTVKSG
ncbi:hypothetical protein Aam_020_088 [Acidocella aminolytica 101 = DSM 11237]|uniref:Uncharacterized protein n=1 Tax=Acidocella aminolytica 101 = DSM 11237 TaxID=1120923 RepID=A0A0D6PEN3_9PROT|nr:hypothetical protein Aam_020_088 [Acidocella aminolytica 101 = DSM 11237]GBQ39527.1 hypothetical protein AA11237_2095 [Acidocella aminolytica 101 = DSM 11237]